MAHPELVAEQAHLDRAHARLDALRAAARGWSAEERTQRTEITPSARVERDARVQLTAQRLADLNIGDLPVAFGRLDMISGERFHVGRIGIADVDGEQLVVDWRAPVARAFYQATGAEPLGVRRRRHFHLRGRQIVGLDDELLDGGGEGLTLVGEAALLAALERRRTGRMADIVATIQAEQDEVVRAPLPGVLVVQGGPGTGKTAVALHRAAYLLYTHRARLERAGVLVIGPNPLFLRYVDEVLPSLGEEAVTLTTASQLAAPGVAVSGGDPPDVARLKGDRRMAGVLAAGLRLRQRSLRADLTVPSGSVVVRVPVAELRSIVAAARRRDGTHHARRPYVERRLRRALAAAFDEAEARAVRAGLRGQPSKPDERAQLLEVLARRPEVRAGLQRMWPVLSPAAFVDDLLGTEALLRRAAAGLLSDDEVARLLRPRADDPDHREWTGADAALLDEADALLGPLPIAAAKESPSGLPVDVAAMLERGLADFSPVCRTCASQLSWSPAGRDPWLCEACDKRWPTLAVTTLEAEFQFLEVRDRLLEQLMPAVAEGPGERRTYGHVVVDEAQEVSAMQWRAIGRRCPSGSFTVVGDLAQASGGGGASGAGDGSPEWAAALADLPGADQVRLAELSVNYRTPEEVMAMAAQVLDAMGLGLRPPRSVRSTGEGPRVVPIDGEAVARAAQLAAIVAAETEAVGDGRVAVIAPPGEVAAVASRVGAPDPAGPPEAVLDAPVGVYDVLAAKGLEFDSVVVVEPARVVAAHGLAGLYVALTRTTGRLTIVHADPLPEPLTS